MDWKDEFLKLYLSGNHEDFCKALELKREHLPKKLYRFRLADEMNYVRSEIWGQLFLPYIGSLNDPFDSRSLLMADAAIGDYFEPKMQKKTLEEIAKREFPEEIFTGKDWFENVIEYLFREDERSEDEKEKVKVVLLKTVEEMLQIMNRDFNKNAQMMLRVASFTEKLTNLPMWNHYANGHQGICMEYDVENIQNVYLKNRLFPVNYVPKLPNATELIEHRRNQETESQIGLYDYFAMHKLSDWAYEKEWRLIINLGHELKNPEDIQNKWDGEGVLHWFTMPSRVYLGAKISEERKADIKKLCDEYKIEVRQMKCTEYGLKDFPVD